MTSARSSWHTSTNTHTGCLYVTIQYIFIPTQPVSLRAKLFILFQEGNKSVVRLRLEGPGLVWAGPLRVGLEEAALSGRGDCGRSQNQPFSRDKPKWCLVHTPPIVFLWLLTTLSLLLLYRFYCASHLYAKASRINSVSVQRDVCSRHLWFSCTSSAAAQMFGWRIKVFFRIHHPAFFCKDKNPQHISPGDSRYICEAHSSICCIHFFQNVRAGKGCECYRNRIPQLRRTLSADG